MVVLIAGASHAGKTLLAQRLLEKYQYPYLSVDHLKMGLIRSGNTSLRPEDDEALTLYLWPIVREIVKTAIENRQNLVIEGCYIPFDWEKDFTDDYKKEIRYCCLILSQDYIKAHFSDIKKYAGVIERRLDDSDCTLEAVLAENARNLELCRLYGQRFLLVDGSYEVDLELEDTESGERS